MTRTMWDEFSQQNMADRSQAINNNPGVMSFGQLQSNLFNAPQIAYLTISKDSPAWSIYDLGAFSQNLMLSAKNKGLDSIPAY